MSYRLSIFLFLGLNVFKSFAQDTVRQNTVATSLNDLIKNSKIDFNARSIYMTSVNEGSLTDGQAWAAGIGAGITTKSLYGFQLGISSYVIYNVWSTDLTALDPATGMPNRYEIGLFDVQNLKQKQNIVRLENLYLKYSYSKSSLSVGKMKLNSPFINPQDGRMNLTLVEGAWLSIEQLKKLSIAGGWLWGVSPRSTTKWYSVPGSFGLYPTGVTETGSRSAYYNNIQNCTGIAMLNIVYKPTEKFKITAWDMLVDNVMNSAFLELTNEAGSNWKLYQGLMYIHQDAINNGGNKNQLLTYVTQGSQANVISAQIGLKNKRINSNFNYTHITGDGRYLSPREWGRDPFYTFMMRERNDGFGNLHAITNKTTFYFFNNALKTSAGYGIFILPDVKDYRLNKYGMPSYHQVNLDMAYDFHKFMKGMTLRVIGAYKLKEGDTYGNLKFVYNKVNMLNLTCMVDYKF